MEFYLKVNKSIKGPFREDGLEEVAKKYFREIKEKTGQAPNIKLLKVFGEIDALPTVKFYA